MIESPQHGDPDGRVGAKTGVGLFGRTIKVEFGDGAASAHQLDGDVDESIVHFPQTGPFENELALLVPLVLFKGANVGPAEMDTTADTANVSDEMTSRGHVSIKLRVINDHVDDLGIEIGGAALTLKQLWRGEG